MDRLPQERYDHADLIALTSSERTVNPVVADIIVVTLTVILESVLGTFALNPGNTVQDYTPRATFSFEYEDGDQTHIKCGISDDAGTDQVELPIIHESREEFDETRLTLTDYEGNTATWNECATTNVSELTVGVKATTEIDSLDTIRLLWVVEDSEDDTSAITKHEGSEA